MAPQPHDVLKFGGTSLADSQAIERCLSIVQSHGNPSVAVVSAMGGITDLLLGALDRASSGKEEDSSCQQFLDKHAEAIKRLIPSEAQHAELLTLVESTAETLRATLQGVTTLRECSTSVRDRVVSRGEHMMAQIFAAALNHRQHVAEFIDATDLICLDDTQDIDLPNLERTETCVRQSLIPRLNQQITVVVPGFYGAADQGKIKTLGRGGTDLSAAILGHCTAAAGVFLYKDIDGILTADPKAVSGARIVPELHYREASELAYFGAKVLHPRTIIPLTKRQIPLYIRNTFAPDQTGTRIAADVTPGAFPVKALTANQGQCLVTIEGNGMMGVPGIAGRTFSALAAASTSVSMISQASSESSICFIVPESDGARVEAALHKEFRFETSQNLIDRIRTDPGKAVVAVVGLGMRGTKGIAARAFSALAERQVSIDAIAQGASELNISVVIDRQNTSLALEGLHREFHLERIGSHRSTEQGVAQIAILGFGNIGRALTRQIRTQREYFADKMQLKIACRALADRSGLVASEVGFSDDELEHYLRRKESQGRLSSSSVGQAEANLESQLEQEFWGAHAVNPILVDLTANETIPIVRQALAKRCHVVCANKKPLAGAQADYRDLVELARENGVSLRYEATVGAGLPVMDTIDKMTEAGDEVFEILGCLSGTLGFLFHEMGSGTPFSQVVRIAHGKGFTEPDPREDLCGMDVARKALILARRLGHTIEPEDLEVESLFPDEVSHDDPDTFMNQLAQCDASWTERLAKAHKKQQVLRYVARITRDSVRVGIEEVDSQSPLGGLRGTDNQITIRTRLYDHNPLVLTGPGAGIEVTAAGVLNDIIAIATSSAGQRGTSL